MRSEKDGYGDKHFSKDHSWRFGEDNHHFGVTKSPKLKLDLHDKNHSEDQSITSLFI